jgi:hypothetical protein
MEAASTAEGQRFADLPRDRKEELWNSAKLAEDTEPVKTPSIAKVANT